MAFKLPLFSNSKKEALATAEQSIASESDLIGSQFDAENTIIGQQDGAGASDAPAASLLNDVMEKGGDIRLPFIGHLPPQRQIRLLSITLGGALLLVAFFVWLNSNYAALSSLQTQIAGDALMHSQRIGKAAPNAIQGNAEAFKQLDESRKEFNKDLTVLSKGGVYQGRDIGTPDAAFDAMLKDAQKVWTNSDKAADTILKLRKELTGFGATLQKLNTLSPVLLELTEQISTLKVQNGASSREIS